jgi:hypothetical protein
MNRIKLGGLLPLILFAVNSYGQGLSFDLTTFSSSTYARLLMTDSLGRRAGTSTPGNEDQFLEIPESSAGLERIDPEENGWGQEGYQLYINNAASGVYTLSVLGIATTGYLLAIHATATNGTLNPGATEYAGFITRGATRIYQLTYSPVPGSPVTVKSDVSFASLRQSLQAAFQAGQVGDAKFVAKLDKILAEGERTLSRKGGKDEHDNGKEEAVEKLREFIKELEKAAADDEDKHGKPGHEHGKKDKRFVSPHALSSLRADAQVLIEQLQPRHHHDDEQHDHDDHEKKNDDRHGDKEHDR